MKRFRERHRSICRGGEGSRRRGVGGAATGAGCSRQGRHAAARDIGRLWRGPAGDGCGGGRWRATGGDAPEVDMQGKKLRSKWDKLTDEMASSRRGGDPRWRLAADIGSRLRFADGELLSDGGAS
ncbi:hypothetical protein ZWY2020_026129 [Hordeum vulgare]|nr:hypothetical protein ZWY2020_026129 [Hordeum vulgare]